MLKARGTEGVALSGKKGLYQDGSLERPMLAPKGQYGLFRQSLRQKDRVCNNNYYL